MVLGFMLISTWAGTAIIRNLFISNDQQPRTIESGINTLKRNDVFDEIIIIITRV